MKWILKSKLRTYAVSASFFLHIVLFLLWALGERFNLFSADIESQVVADPIVFELQPENPRQKPTQVVETPDDAELSDKPQDADYLSDKNALARNEEAPENLPAGRAFAQGDLFAAEMPTQRGPQGNNGASASKITEFDEQRQKESSVEDLAIRKEASDFRRDHLVSKAASTSSAGVKESSQRALYDNQESRALRNGGLSFNTYNWEFAPYMLWLKRHVEQNIFPPPAYTRLGMIEGETVVRFRIHRSGKLEQLEILDYKGHKTLMETSYRAIEISAPFKKLPADFPEPYLEVTAVFKYSVHK